MPKVAAARHLLAILLAIALPSFSGAAWAQAAAEKPAAKAPAIAIAESTTRHVLNIAGGRLDYVATAGTLPVLSDRQEVQGQAFYVAYQVPGGDTADRPIAFVFNGGPGAASAYLHLGMVGPRRLVINGDGSQPPGPARLADNPLTWLAFTDLVFIDPIGTGYSLPAGDDDKHVRDRFYGVRQDLRVLGQIIQLYLTRNGRWSSPKYLVGESYGGFRAAILTDYLQTEFGIAVQGALLVSPVLQFSLQREDSYRLLPWVVRLPTYAAVARFQRNPAQAAPGQDLAALQRPVEDFSLTTLLADLGQGDGLQPSAADALYRRLAELTGLPVDLVARYRGRIPTAVFVKELLRSSGRALSFYDGSLANPDPRPAEPFPTGPDAELSKINASLTAAISGYLRDELKVVTDRPYRVLNSDVSRAWNWRSWHEHAQGFVGAAGNLQAALNRNPGLKVIVAHGYYDLVTPYFASAYVLRQMALPEALRANVMLKVYAGGHMIYTHGPAQRQLYDDARALIRGEPEPAKRD